MYSDLVMDHFMNPRNVGIISDADGIGLQGNAECGDLMKIYITIDGDRIGNVKFQTFGCGAAIASSSIITEMVMGKTIDEAMAITSKAVATALGGLPPGKLHCATLAADALHKALEDYLAKRRRAVPEPKAT